MNAGHAGRPLDVGDPDWGGLLEAEGEAQVLDLVSIDHVHGKSHQLLLGLIVPVNAGKLPVRNDNSALVDDNGAAAIAGQGLTIDGHITVPTGILGLKNIQAEGLGWCQYWLSTHLLRGEPKGPKGRTNSRLPKPSNGGRRAMNAEGMASSGECTGLAPTSAGASRRAACNRPRIIRRLQSMIQASDEWRRREVVRESDGDVAELLGKSRATALEHWHSRLTEGKGLGRV